MKPVVTGRWAVISCVVAFAVAGCAGAGAGKSAPPPERRDLEFEREVEFFRGVFENLPPCLPSTVSLSVEEVLEKTWAQHDTLFVRGRLTSRDDHRTCTLMACEGRRCCNTCSDLGEPGEETWTLTGTGGAIAVVGVPLAHRNRDCAPAAQDVAFRDGDVVLTLRIAEAGRIRNEWRTQAVTLPPVTLFVCRPGRPEKAG